MNLIHRIFCIFFIFFISGCHKAAERADLVVRGGKIYTVDAKQPIVEAVAVKENTILFAGSESEILKYTDDATRVIDLQGKTMTPGLIEGHAHLMGIGHNAMNLDLMTAESYDEIIARVKLAVSKAKPGQWILGRGWHQDKWDRKPVKMVKGFQTHDLLSEVSPENPVFLRHASGHAALANARAMQIAGLHPLSIEKIPYDGTSGGGEVIRDASGNPTGIFSENAMGLISRHIPENDAAIETQALELALATCLRNGITSFHDAGAGRETIELYKQFQKDNKLSVRLYVMLTGHNAALMREWMSKGPEIDPDYFLTIRSIKLSCDGALGSRGAWLLEPYDDRPDFYGMATFSMDSVLSIAREALKNGFQVCTHAIGDRTNREVLNRYESAFNEYPELAKDHRFRIEHAQHLHPLDIPRFGQLGVIAAMQAIHMSSDRPWAIDRLGEKRIKEGAYMWQSLLKNGARIANGTDAPVEPLNPVPSFYASVTRQTLKGEPEGGFEPGERMTREQALRSYTLDAAYAAFQEDALGSIEAGKLADFTVFSKDLMTIGEDEILQSEVVMTIVGGKIAYKKEN